jgi:hypothetical protein
MWLDRLSSFIARYKGLPTMIAIALVALNFVFHLFMRSGWLVETDFLLHLGVIIGFVGLMLAAALG